MHASNATARTERIGAAAGVVFVVMTIVGVGMYPNLQLPLSEAAIQAAYVDRAGTAALSAVLQLLSILPFAVFLMALWRRLRVTDEALAMITLLGGFATAVAILTWQGVIVGVLIAANRLEGVDPRPILAVVAAMDQAITLPLAILVGSAGTAILIGRSLSRLLGWLGIITAVIAIVGVLAILAVFTTNIGEVVAAANPLALLLFLIWVIGVSVAFVRSSDPGA